MRSCMCYILIRVNFLICSGEIVQMQFTLVYSFPTGYRVYSSKFIIGLHTLLLILHI